MKKGYLTATCVLVAVFLASCAPVLIEEIVEYKVKDFLRSDDSAQPL